MPEYVFRGSVTLNGVWFYISAKDEADAKERARLGKYDEYDETSAETSDWKIDPGSIEEN